MGRGGSGTVVDGLMIGVVGSELTGSGRGGSGKVVNGLMTGVEVAMTGVGSELIGLTTAVDSARRIGSMTGRCLDWVLIGVGFGSEVGLGCLDWAEVGACEGGVDWVGSLIVRLMSRGAARAYEFLYNASIVSSDLALTKTWLNLKRSEPETGRLQ